MPGDAEQPPTALVELTRSDDSLTIATPSYRLVIEHLERSLVRAPTARLDDARGRTWSHLSLLASAHTLGGADETLRVESVNAERIAGAVELRVVMRSSVWRRRELVLTCSAETIEASLELDGEGSLTTLTMFGGRGAMPNSASGQFRSAIRFAGVLVPTPTEPVALVRPSSTPGALGVIGDADAGRLERRVLAAAARFRLLARGADLRDRAPGRRLARTVAARTRR